MPKRKATWVGSRRTKAGLAAVDVPQHANVDIVELSWRQAVRQGLIRHDLLGMDSS